MRPKNDEAEARQCEAQKENETEAKELL